MKGCWASAGIGLQTGLKNLWSLLHVGSNPTSPTMNPLNEINKTKKELKEKMLTLMLAGFGLVAALAWNDAIQTLFRLLFPESEGVIGKFSYAVIVTALVVIISLQLKKASEEKE